MIERIGNLLEGIGTNKLENIRSERALVLFDLIKEINKEREGTKYKPVNPQFIAIKTSHLKLRDLKWLFQTCEKYKKEGKGNFSKAFYGMLKVKK